MAAAKAAAGFAAAEQTTSDELAPVAGWVSTRGAEHAAQADLLRDIFGSLSFRPQVAAPSALAWSDRLVVRLAEVIYAEQRWADLPLLADALLDAGCDDDELVAHLRGPGPHTRGCFALDLLLSRPESGRHLPPL